ncbi:hypothetical protein Thexy_0758 [Thermoanaerobacterium xylanolyticum LX-11]|uniref:Uncharacterized protein n=1 Tax=Thermoanaerobacterium xylanolyticum (strain ATCC 49914 / DSM 7097 / LX-11) TaxID=858215 RepID=F6BIQ7_THEXL|nr:hypothetical protein Thexy_0758 [Thermoanaerobacterium xylanolyticum LX-11]
MTNKPNSIVERIDANGNIIQRRYYGSNGQAVKDIDYTNHGNPNQHPEVPHEHTCIGAIPINLLESKEVIK